MMVKALAETLAVGARNGLVRKGGKNEVFRSYLMRYTFQPRKTRVHSITMAHGYVVVEEPTLNLQEVARYQMPFPQKWPKSDICRKKWYSTFISSDTASRPRKVVFVRFVWSVAGLKSNGHHSICKEFRELACFAPEKWQITHQNSFWCLFLQINLPDPS